MFISFEGGDGSGKTTHINFLAQALRSLGYEVLCLREPGGTAVGEAMRDVVLNPENSVCDQAELLMYEAARAQLVSEVIKPALEANCVVLCDRFFDSTTAYQAHGRGLDLDLVERVNMFASQGLVPDRTLLIATEDNPQVSLDRATKDRDGDRMERAGIEFHMRVKQAFRGLAHDNPQRIRMLAIQPTKAQTARLVFGAVADLFGWDPENLPFDEAYFEAANSISGETKRKASDGHVGSVR